MESTSTTTLDVAIVPIHGISTERDPDSWFLPWITRTALLLTTPHPSFSIRARPFPVYWEDLMSNGHTHKQPWREPRARTYLADLTGDIQSLWDDEVIARVKSQIYKATETDLPTIIVSHSMGTVLAYRALHELPSLPPPHFITVGSPLLRLQTFGLTGMLAKPSCVHTWHNVHGLFDPVVAPLHTRFALRGGIPCAHRNYLSLTRHDATTYIKSPAYTRAIKSLHIPFP